MPHFSGGRWEKKVFRKKDFQQDRESFPWSYLRIQREPRNTKRDEYSNRDAGLLNCTRDSLKVSRIFPLTAAFAEPLPTCFRSALQYRMVKLLFQFSTGNYLKIPLLPFGKKNY